MPAFHTPMLPEQLHALEMRPIYGVIEGRVLVIVGSVWVSSYVVIGVEAQKKANDLYMAFQGSDSEWGVTMLVFAVDICVSS
jgi:hypothetical protein